MQKQLLFHYAEEQRCWFKHRDFNNLDTTASFIWFGRDPVRPLVGGPTLNTRCFFQKKGNRIFFGMLLTAPDSLFCAFNSACESSVEGNSHVYVD